MQKYRDYIAMRGKNNGIVPHKPWLQYRRAVVTFLQFCNLPITDHTLNDLVLAKQADPTNTEIEKALRKFTTMKGTRKRLQQASIICGIFNRGNFTPLKIHVNTHYIPPKQEIPEITIKAIFRESTPEMQVLQQLQASLGERINAIGFIKEKDIKLDIDPNYAVVYFDGTTTKGHITHFSICPKQVALDTIEIMHKTNRQYSFPNYETLWEKITDYALKNYNMHYTSHYLRAKFETTADDTGISMNKVNYWMGGAPHGTDDTARLGHLPEIYILKEAKKHIRFYDKFLATPLLLSNNTTSIHTP
ncbi:MAG: hypothetical protein ACHQ1H_05260 [Nitrososphaerales archaeon]